MKILHGKIRGKTVELEENPGLADGQEVEVRVPAVPERGVWGEGLRQCAGAMAGEWTEEDDRILEQIYQERKQDTRREVPGE